jgi:cation transport ATPase
MLLAVLYVTRHGNVEEAEKSSVVRRAALIFWAGTFLMGFGLLFVVNMVFAAQYSGAPTWGSEAADYTAGYAILAAQFFAAFVAANGANDLIRRHRWYVRVPLFVACIAMYLVLLVSLFLSFRRPAINVMQFATCMLPTHYWGRFKDAPNQPNAWAALLACLAGATLFFGASYFGEDFAQWVCRMFPFLIWRSVG